MKERIGDKLKRVLKNPDVQSRLNAVRKLTNSPDINLIVANEGNNFIINGTNESGINILEEPITLKPLSSYE